MKRLITKILTITACIAMLLTAGPIANTQSVQAAPKAQGTVDLKAKKLVIPKGKTQKIKSNTLQMVKGRRYQVKTKFGSTTVTKTGTYKSSKPAVATVSSTGLVTAKAPGTTTIKVTYNGKSQSFKIKVVDTSAHKHTWKTLTKATCASKGKKLCKTCGATGSTAMKTTHSFEVTKKANCRVAGKKTCSVCGTTESIAKTSHNYVTKKTYYVEGRGKAFSEYTLHCGGCDTDMTHWTQEQKAVHMANLDDLYLPDGGCFGRNAYGVAGETRYPNYVKMEMTGEYCTNCGQYSNNSVEKVLYNCDMYGYKIPDGEDAWSVFAFEKYCNEHKCAKHICADKHSAQTTAKKAPAKAVAAPQDVITNTADVNTDTVVSDEIIDETVSESIVSDNSLSKVNTEITVPDGDGDSVFNDPTDDTFDKSLSDNDR